MGGLYWSAVVTNSRSVRGVLLAAAVIAGLGYGCRNVLLTPEEAATALRTSPAFTQRAASPVGRELVEVVSVRRLGKLSAEVEFTWRDTPGPAGPTAPPVRTSMALYRRLWDGTWALASLYRVD